MKNSPGHIALKTGAIISALTLGGGLIAYRQLSAEGPETETTPPEKPATSPAQESGELKYPKDFSFISSSKRGTVFTSQDVSGALAQPQRTTLSGSKSAIGIITPTEAERMLTLTPNEAATLTPFTMTRLGPPVFSSRDVKSPPITRTTVLSGSKSMIGIITPAEAEKILTPKDAAELARFRITPLGQEKRAKDSTTAGGFVYYVTEIALEKTDPARASFRVIVAGDKIQTLPTEAAARVSDALRKKLLQSDRYWQATYSTYEEPAKTAEPRRLQTYYAMPSSKSALIFKFEADADGTIRAVGGDGKQKPDAGFFDAVRAYLQDNPKPAAR